LDNASGASLGKNQCLSRRASSAALSRAGGTP
jgi:hypothetical protein